MGNAPYRIISAPTSLGLKITGVERAPQILLANQLHKWLRADVVNLPPAIRTERSMQGVLHAKEIAAYSTLIGNEVREALRCGRTPIVLGGDNSILLGAGLGLSSQRHNGLLSLEGHEGYHISNTSRTGEVADMALALATGYGTPVLSRLRDEALFQPASIVSVGFRDEAELLEDGCLPLKGIGTSISYEEYHANPDIAHDRISQRLRSPYWIHLDVDVLDDAWMPAVNYRQPGGMQPEELVTLLSQTAKQRRPNFLGMTFSMYNPSRDTKANSGHLLCTILEQGLKTK